MVKINYELITSVNDGIKITFVLAMFLLMVTLPFAILVDMGAPLWVYFPVGICVLLIIIMIITEILIEI
jgi:hypothetical protein